MLEPSLRIGICLKSGRTIAPNPMAPDVNGTMREKTHLKSLGREGKHVKTIYYARVAELADAMDLKSIGRNTMWVRFPPFAPYINIQM